MIDEIVSVKSNGGLKLSNYDALKMSQFLIYLL